VKKTTDLRIDLFIAGPLHKRGGKIALLKRMVGLSKNQSQLGIPAALKPTVNDKTEQPGIKIGDKWLELKGP
jgi:hypothetical protein